MNYKLHKVIEISSYLYLLLPIVLFSFGWLKPIYAVLITGSLLYACYAVARSSKRTSNLFQFKQNVLPIVVCVVFLIIWVVVSGAGGIGRQTMDYNKHDALMSDLVNRSWPVQYNSGSDTKPLVYYVAYYLPAAAVGKAVKSVEFTQIAMLLWTTFGILFVFYWLCRITRGPKISLVIMFIFFSGMDIIGHILIHTTATTIPLLNISSSLEWYTYLGNLQYSSNTTLLNWVPQQAIPGWLTAGIIAAIITERNRHLLTFGACLIAISLLWSPFVSVGLLPLYGAALYLNGRQLFKLVDWKVVPAILFVLITLGFYYLAGSTHQPAGSFLGYSHDDWGWLKKLTILATFILVEYGALALLLSRHVIRRESIEWKVLFVSTTFFLTILPFLRYGIFNDLVMRASIPSLFILMTVTYRYLADGTSESRLPIRAWTHTAIIIVLAFGSITALIELNSHLRGPYSSPESWHSIGNPNLSPSEKLFTSQYMGTNQSFFFRTLSR